MSSDLTKLNWAETQLKLNLVFGTLKLKHQALSFKCFCIVSFSVEVDNEVEVEN